MSRSIELASPGPAGTAISSTDLSGVPRCMWLNQLLWEANTFFYALTMDDRVPITVSEAARRLDTYPNAINRWIAKGELEAFGVDERGFRFVDAEQVRALGLALVGLQMQENVVPDAPRDG